MYTIESITDVYRSFVDLYIAEYWAGPYIVSKIGKIFANAIRQEFCDVDNSADSYYNKT